MAVFRDRKDAGKRLARALESRGYEQPIVLGIPRGGVVLSAEIARALDADHGVVVARKLGAPGQPELAVGAITASGATYIDTETARMVGASDEYLEQVKKEQQEEARRREEQFNSRRRPPLAGRTVIVVDDGVATGATAIAALRSVRQEGAARVVFAIPVGPPHTVAALRDEADEVICLIEEPYFFAVGQFYDEFGSVSNREVSSLLEELERERAGLRYLASENPKHPSQPSDAMEG